MKLVAAVTDAAKLIELEAGHEYTILTANRVEKIPCKDIFYIQREGKNSCIVNIIHIMKISDGMVVLKNGEQLSISRSHLQEVKQKINQFFGGSYMMECILVISYFLTNEIRLFFGLFIAAKVMNFSLEKRTLVLSAIGGVMVTILQKTGLPTIGVLTIELLVITAVTWYCLRDKLNLCLFLSF